MLENFIKQLPKIDTSQHVFAIPQFPGTAEDTINYNRKCYTYFRDFIFGDRNFMRYCITGNPGIGKTYFGRLMLVELLKQGKSVLIDFEGCTLFISPKEFASLPNTWCIIDGREPQKEMVKRFIKAQREDEIVDCYNRLYKETITQETLKNKFELCEIKKDEKYYRPTSKNFESIDSYVHRNKLFQVIVAKRHGIKQDGLRMIKGILDESCKINFYFVLPKDVFAKFTKKQTYENKGGGKVSDAWIYEIDQYALCNQYSF
ncbi:hypothetical protein C2G38_2126519 [Gigaspora rosea]|uniref:Uncharacterized protein n=1 Tax=Gigaspora rosea TaxID=44941 RepID=A0A397TWW1_9GLOM|nr:hypothetical protein C2G38_2126519 [Gigaspora rosea]